MSAVCFGYSIGQGLNHMAMALRFEWDPRKSESNKRKHGIDFAVALSIFKDPLNKLEIEGNEHGEIRWRTIGEIDRVIFIVSHTIREEEKEEGEIEVVRIISARPASRRERQEYEGTP